MRTRLFRLLVVSLLVLAAQTGARADEPAGEDAALAAAKTHFEGGRAAYMAGDYGRAVQEFQTAQGIRPSPILDYNIGLAYEGLGDAGRAVDSYRRFLTLKPDAPNRADVEARITALQSQAQAQQQQAGQYQQQGPYPAAGNPYPQGTYYPPVQPTMPPRPRRSRWWIAPVVIGAVVLTVVVVAVAVVASNNATYYNTPYLQSAPEGSHPSQNAQMPLLASQPLRPGIPVEQPALLRF